MKENLEFTAFERMREKSLRVLKEALIPKWTKRKEENGKSLQICMLQPSFLRMPVVGTGQSRLDALDTAARKLETKWLLEEIKDQNRRSKSERRVRHSPLYTRR